MTRRLRVFLSSPGDVGEERLRAHLVIQKLARDYARFFRIEPYLWEHEPMLASGHFQDAIEPPSTFDVVVLVVHARLGTVLPERTGLRSYRGIDGRTPVTGTEWEFEDALEAHRSRGTPDLLAYRKLGDPGVPLADPVRRAEQERQWDALQCFWQRHFENGGMFLAGSAQFRTLEEFDRKFEADMTALIERRIAEGHLAEAAASEASWLRGSPFRGLSAYEFEDAPVFFGRDAQTRTALTRLQAAAEQGCAFLLVLGASGSGKSSLARAGILPGLFGPKAIPGVGLWRRVLFRPGDGAEDPVLGLARAIAAGDPAQGIGLPEMLGPGMTAETLAAHLAAAPDDPSFPFRVALEGLAQAGRARGLLPHETARLVIVVDQLEEVFTQTADPARRACFLRLLAGLARSSLVWVVATLRNDLWHHVAGAPVLLDLVEAGARLDLPQPDGSEIIEIIRRPARAAGLVFETAADSGVALDAAMARAAAEEPGALPLLSVMLDTLFERDIRARAEAGEAAGTLTFATYRALGELRGAIAQRAEQALEALRQRDPEAAAALPKVLRALVTTAGGDKVTSRPAPLAGFADGGPEMRLIRHFLVPEVRLLITSGGDGGAEIRLAHEALIENWPAAREQIGRDRRDIETRNRLEALERRWAEASGAERRRALLTGLNLAEGTDLVGRWRMDPDSRLAVYVAASRRADRLRRNRAAVMASALMLGFAGLAGAAALQWNRAEDQARMAQQAAEAEREARTTAERERQRADAERAHALENERRALAALRDTRRETARALATEAELAAGQRDVRRALELAVQAGRTERDVLGAGETAASAPALLQATADLREVLQIRGPRQGLAMPYAFFGDDRLAYADRSGVLVLAELGNVPRIATRARLPERFVPTQIRPLPAAGLVAVAGGTRLLLVDAQAGEIRRDISLPARITSLDATEDARLIAIGTGAAIALVSSAEAQDPRIVGVPQERPGMTVAQVRFDRSGQVLFASYGAEVLSFDIGQSRFGAAPVAELDASAIGFNRELLENILVRGRGLVSVVELIPNLARDKEILLRNELELRSVDPATGAAQPYPRGSVEEHVLGVSFTDQGRSGAIQEAVAVLGRRDNTNQEFRLQYLTDEGKLLAFDAFSIRAADLGGETVRSCQVSRNLSYLACQFWGDADQGMAVWRLLGGNHRFERLANAPGSSAVLAEASAEVILTTDDAIAGLHEGRPAPLAALSTGWRLTGRQGPYLVAASEPAGQVRIWRQDAKGALGPVLGPLDAREASLDAEAGRAVLRTADQLIAHDLGTGQRQWMVPGLPGLRAASITADGSRVIAVAREAAYVFDAADGHILAFARIAAAEDRPVAIEPGRAVLAFIEGDGAARVLDAMSGQASRIAADCTAAQLAWNPAGSMLLVGCRTGAVLAFDPSGKPLWSIPSPLGGAFREGESWPGQPPKGLVLQLAFSPDGRRLAIIRQDLQSIDLHDAATGQYESRLTSPWSFGVPARVSLGEDGLVLANWAAHAMTRTSPRQVTLHRLPDSFPAALAGAEARLAALRAIWSPAGPPAPGPAAAD